MQLHYRHAATQISATLSIKIKLSQKVLLTSDFSSPITSASSGSLSKSIKGAIFVLSSSSISVLLTFIFIAVFMIYKLESSDLS
ncbi:hypothetical protein RIF29_27741 [Crotalaria pallida]|uniref:Uncharacterized protein n=1 Tax=Crotalaria pallida TaxID=3830 RepID=A0AAN9I5W5_CROPI